MSKEEDARDERIIKKLKKIPAVVSKVRRDAQLPLERTLVPFIV